MSWQQSTLGEECELYQPQTLAKNQLDNSGTYKVYGANGIIGTHIEFNHAEPQLLLGCRGTCGVINLSVPNAWINGNAMVVKPKSNKLDLIFLKHYLQYIDLSKAITGASQPQITRQTLSPIRISFPNLEEQKRIAAILDKAAEIKAKREKVIVKLDEFEVSAFEECCSNTTKQSVIKIKNLVIKRKPIDRTVGKVWSLALDQIEGNSGELLSQEIVSKAELGTSTYYFEPGVVLYSKLRPYLNKVVTPKTGGYATTELIPLYCDKEKILPIFMAAYLRSKKFVNYANINSAGAKMPRVIMDKFWDYEMKLPNLVVQQNFQQLSEKCSAIKKSLKRSIEKQDKLIASLEHIAFTTGFKV